MKRIADAFRAARKIEIVLVAVMIAVMAVIMLSQENAPSSAAGSEEQRMERLLSRIEGAGQVDVMINSGEDGVRGCVVVADGAGDMRVLLKMRRAVQAALDIPAENIEIIPSGG